MPLSFPDGTPRARLAAAAALALILAALLLYATLWPRAAWYLVPPADRPLAERALREGAAQMAGMDSDSYRWLARPRVSHPPGLDCVTLTSWARDRAGSYDACYDARTGRPVYERLSGH